jgi:hypothetical protein
VASVKSRYQNLHRIGTLSLILAWVVLVVGILAAIGVWLGLNQVSSSLRTNFEMPNGLGPAPLLAALPGLLAAVLVFLQFYIIGKVLHLLVDLEARSAPSQQAAPAVATPATGGDSEISGELNRQAKLIASNLEATQAIQQQLASLQARMSGGSAPAVVAAAATGASPAEPAGGAS